MQEGKFLTAEEIAKQLEWGDIPQEGKEFITDENGNKIEVKKDVPKVKNENLTTAKKAKNDEFYTQFSDINRELCHYKEHFKDKIVYLNCDGLAHDNDCEIRNGRNCTCDPCTVEKSEFWNYFQKNFEFFGLKKLIATRWDPEYPTYKLELTGDYDGDGKITNFDIVKTRLKANGDFRNQECITILKESDIVVTNPPFSLFRDFIKVMFDNDKKFLILGNNNAITYKEVFKLIKENKLWLGTESNRTMEFRIPDSYQAVKLKRKDNLWRQYVGVPSISWFTNLEHKNRNEELSLVLKYYEKESDKDNPNYINPKYPKYDNYDAIEVSKVAEIPKDYDGVMGVPITFLKYYNPNQNTFKIVGDSRYHSDDEKANDLTLNGGGFTEEFSSSVQNNRFKSSLLYDDWTGAPENKTVVINRTERSLRKNTDFCFEILGMDDHRINWRGRGPDLNGKPVYRRIIIKRKQC